MNRLLVKLALGLSAVMGREMHDACEPNEPDTCDQVGEKGGCCMVWEAMYHSRNNFLYVEVGREYK